MVISVIIGRSPTSLRDVTSCVTCWWFMDVHACRWFVHIGVSASRTDVAAIRGTSTRSLLVIVSRAGDVWRQDVAVSFLDDIVTRGLVLTSDLCHCCLQSRCYLLLIAIFHHHSLCHR